MRKIISIQNTVILAILLSLWFYLFYPRPEYRIPDKLNEKFVIQTWIYSSSWFGEKNYVNNRNYLLDTSNYKFIYYTGSFNTGWVIIPEDNETIKYYNKDESYYIKSYWLYDKNNIAIKVDSIRHQYRYWIKGWKYVVMVWNISKYKWIFKFSLGDNSIYIFDPKYPEKQQQIIFFDPETPNAKIIDIIGTID